MNIFYLFAPFFLFTHTNFCFSQQTPRIPKKLAFDSVYNQIAHIIENNGSFKDAVFLAEQAFQNKDAAKYDYDNFVSSYIFILRKKRNDIIAKGYKQSDSINYYANMNLYNIIKKPVSLKLSSHSFTLEPFIYDFADPQGDHDLTNTFVTKLLETHKGNCRSIAYLYKILADELGARCWLALAPNHIYIRNYSKQIGWYNTELTSGTFPTDAWLAATGYISTDAIRSGVYMDTLSNRQSIALCVLDLAQGYIRQTQNYTDGFVLKCCNLVLQYHDVNPEALLIKAESLKRTYLEEKQKSSPDAQSTYAEMEQTYIALVKLGYREMPYKIYQKWLKSAKQDKEKYINKKVKVTGSQHEPY